MNQLPRGTERANAPRQADGRKLRRRCGTLGACILGLLIVVLAPARVLAHEPIFGVGPRVIWKDGLGLQIQLDRQEEELPRQEGKDDREEAWVINYEVLYGLTANQAITLAIPHVLDRRTATAQNGGIGDLLLRYKGRFDRRDVPGGVYHASVLAGVELPTGARDGPLPTGSGTYDVMGGLAAGYEGRLVFGAGRYKRNGTSDAGVDIGNGLIADAAVGFRPVRTAYRRPDTVVMAELNYQSLGRAQREGIVVPNTGRNVLYLSAGVWLTYRNHAFKPGIQLPVHTDDRGGASRPDWRFVVAYEVHTGSLFGR